jgi:predicted amidophosphoribosyltransferase
VTGRSDARIDLDQRRLRGRLPQNVSALGPSAPGVPRRRLGRTRLERARANSRTAADDGTHGVKIQFWNSDFDFRNNEDPKAGQFVPELPIASRGAYIDRVMRTPPVTCWRVPRWVRSLAQGAADFVYPPLCRLCAEELPESSSDVPSEPFCEGCRKELLIHHGPACIRCGASIGPYLDPHLPCTMCRNERFAFERVIRLGVYDGILRKACLRCKDRGAEPLAAGLAELLWNCDSAALQSARADVVVAVPQHWFRRFYHPHHAAQTLASVWAARLQLPLATHILRKRRWTSPQARLSPSERRGNLRNAFAATSSAGLSGAAVLLADDVMTTGTTAHETARVLLQAGAARVILAVVARGLGGR